MLEVTLENAEQDITRLINQTDDAIDILQRLCHNPTHAQLDSVQIKHLVSLLQSLRTDLEDVL